MKEESRRKDFDLMVDDKQDEQDYENTFFPDSLQYINGLHQLSHPPSSSDLYRENRTMSATENSDSNLSIGNDLRSLESQISATASSSGAMFAEPSSAEQADDPPVYTADQAKVC